MFYLLYTLDNTVLYNIKILNSANEYLDKINNIEFKIEILVNLYLCFVLQLKTDR